MGACRQPELAHTYLWGWTLGQHLGCCWVVPAGRWPQEAGKGPAAPTQPRLPCRNYTLKCMPLPLSDVAQAFRSHPERTEEAVHKVGRAHGQGAPGPEGTHPWPLTASRLLQLQTCLARNQLRRTMPTQTFPLQQGTLTSASEQVCWAPRHPGAAFPCPEQPWVAWVSCAGSTPPLCPRQGRAPGAGLVATVP